MHKALYIAPLVIAACITHPARAQDAGSELALCLTQKASAQDRKDFARWAFLTMASHPDYVDLMKPTVAASREEATRAAGALATRLVTETCRDAALKAVADRNALAFQNGFAALGQMAMLEVVGNPEVMRSMSSMDAFLDREKLEALAKPRKP
jgi:GTP cyclohydrolase III